MALTYAELFAGAGGLSMGLELAGWECAAHAEIEPHARAVLRHTWPAVRLDGDVSVVDGSAYRGITLLSGGSPCQDLSIAGKRSGMVEGSGTRSSLFFEQVRIWRESDAPYFLWENVLGAFSSNDGRDFAAVLSALVGATVAVPSDGWESAGVAAGPTGVAAWRVLDCQFFGPPQRRRRVFVLGTRTGGVDPAEVLALSEGVCGDSAPRRETGQDAPAGAGGGATGARRTVGFAAGSFGGWEEGIGCSQASNPLSSIALAFDSFNQSLDKVASTLSSGESGRPIAVTYDARGNGEGAVANTLSGDHQNRVTDYTAIVLRNREGKPGGGKGPLLSTERSLTLGTGNDQVVFTKQQQGRYTDAANVDATLAARDHASNNVDVSVGVHGIPRRLMPVECERLMGWPDDHTATGVDESGRTYRLSDTARYRLCGNGVATPVAAWIGFQLAEAIKAQR